MRNQTDYLNLLIKPTNICNLKCKYCFNGNNTDEAQKFLRIEDLEKFLSISFQSSKIIQIVWHGGEPTLVGIDYFKKAFSIISKLLEVYDNKVTQCIQTNGGCNHEAFMGGNIRDNNYFECRVFKTTFSHAKSQVSMLKDYKEINPQIEDIIRQINNK